MSAAVPVVAAFVSARMQMEVEQVEVVLYLVARALREAVRREAMGVVRLAAATREALPTR